MIRIEILMRLFITLIIFSYSLVAIASNKISSDKEEVSENGARIMHYYEEGYVEKSFNKEEAKLRQDVFSHIDQKLGPIDVIIHSISYGEYIDLFIIKPTKDRNYFTLITSVVDNKSTSVNPVDGKESALYTGLLLFLPPEWKLDEREVTNKLYYWPVNYLKFFATMPIHGDIILEPGVSGARGKEEKSMLPLLNQSQIPLSKDIDFTGFIVGWPNINMVSEDFAIYRRDKKTITFFTLYPVYADEMDYKLKYGEESFFELADENNLTGLLDNHRPSIIPKKRP